MQKAKRGFGSGRLIWVAMIGSLSVALAGCGDDESGSVTAANTSGSTDSTGTPQTITDTESNGSGSSTDTGSTGSSGSTGSGSTGSTGSTGSSGSSGSGSTGSGSGSTGSTGSGSSGSGSSGSGSTGSGSTGSSSASVTLDWVAPTQNSNGTPISNLAGYKIHYGTTSASYTQVVAVSNPSLSRYVLDSLTSGTYYFAITAYNTQGIESALSGEITTTLN